MRARRQILTTSFRPKLGAACITTRASLWLPKCKYITTSRDIAGSVGAVKSGSVPPYRRIGQTFVCAIKRDRNARLSAAFIRRIIPGKVSGAPRRPDVRHNICRGLARWDSKKLVRKAREPSGVAFMRSISRPESCEGMASKSRCKNSPSGSLLGCSRILEV